MYKKTTALLVGAFLLSSCRINDDFATGFIDDKSYTMCVVRFTQTSQNKGTLALYTDSKPAIVKDIKNVSFETAQSITNDLGLCRETFRRTDSRCDACHKALSVSSHQYFKSSL